VEDKAFSDEMAFALMHALLRSVHGSRLAELDEAINPDLSSVHCANSNLKWKNSEPWEGTCANPACGQELSAGQLKTTEDAEKEKP